ncbi:60S ribosomal export protein Nmd3p [Trichomonascus vanleenenianus]|uniref:60S ribosomal export protein NMD3 n=1 Tax=Trichomonascus vanleenenianus TaxID=2268995 RepID=UPI003ECA6E82
MAAEFARQQQEIKDLQHMDTRIRRFVPVHTAPLIACCNCGQPMKSIGGQTMCVDCIRLNVDITEDVQKDGTITFCKNCNRLLVPPNQWIWAPRESRELMGACLKRLRGLHKLRLMDASYLWTEPHSRRTKIKITVQGEAKQFQNTLVEQTFVVEFYEDSAQCPDCAKSFTANTWRASVQVRQKVEHKKTFFFLEQVILKSKAHKYTTSIQENKEGLDFFFAQRNHAVKMIEFLSSVVPMRWKKSAELISMNIHTSKKSYKFTYSVEIVPICKEDLVVLPKTVAKSLGHISTLVLCYRIANAVHFIDPLNLQTAEITPGAYWKNPFPALASSKSLTEYMVLDIEPAGPANDRFALADATVARVSDMGRNDTTFYVRTHLGGILNAGDLAWGYALDNSNYNSDLWDELDPNKIPDVILVKKSYSDKPKKSRNWKLKRMAKEYKDVEARPRDKTQDKLNRDFAEFIQELEEDPEFRSEVNIYQVEDEVHDETENEVDEDEVGVKLSELKIDDGVDHFTSDEEMEDDSEDDVDESEQMVVHKPKTA